MAIADILDKLGLKLDLAAGAGLAVNSPLDGAALASVAADTPASVARKAQNLGAAKKRFTQQHRARREALAAQYAAALKTHADALAEIIHLEGGKTRKEALGEVNGAADILLKTIKDTALPELTGMLRVKERPPVGVVGLITSFNFPIAVAHWTLAPALLAANAVLWKPSEKTPLTALACKAVFDKAAGEWAGLLEIAIGGRETGEALVASEAVDMISATGSVGMGQGIKTILAKKKNNAVPPILELGGNNGAIISDRMSEAHLEWSLGCLMNSFLGTTGQRCTNTRRLIVHKDRMDKTVSVLKRLIGDFLKNPLAADNGFGYGPLIDADAFNRFEQAKAQAVAEGGSLLLGNRLAGPQGGFYVEPCLALLPSHAPVMHKETFAPILFIAPYGGDIDAACAMLNAPDNAGLVGAIYTQSQKEADYFASHCEAGHVLINPPKGTGTPAHGMGFGGNKHSGEGEILNSADPLQAFTRPDRFTRIAQNKEIVMQQ